MLEMRFTKFLRIHLLGISPSSFSLIIALHILFLPPFPPHPLLFFVFIFLIFFLLFPFTTLILNILIYIAYSLYVVNVAIQLILIVVAMVMMLFRIEERGIDVQNPGLDLEHDDVQETPDLQHILNILSELRKLQKLRFSWIILIHSWHIFLMRITSTETVRVFPLYIKKNFRE